MISATRDVGPGVRRRVGRTGASSIVAYVVTSAIVCRRGLMGTRTSALAIGT